MEQFGRTKYARQLLRKQPHGERRQSDDPEELEGGPGAGQAASAEAQRAGAAVSVRRSELIPSAENTTFTGATAAPM